jgi:CheY-like chemotaxis protein
MLQEHFNLEIEEANNGLVALEKFKEGLNRPCGCQNRAYKLILMDLQMPVMNGIEATRLIML